MFTYGALGSDSAIPLQDRTNPFPFDRLLTSSSRLVLTARHASRVIPSSLRV